MFVRMLSVHCDQNDSSEITMDSYQGLTINEIRNSVSSLFHNYPLGQKCSFYKRSISDDHIVELKITYSR